MEPFIGQIMLFAGNFAPRSWAFCDGQLISIAQNTALFSILGTTYGGDGRTTFGLPDLRGRAPIHPGAGPGLSTRKLGQRSGLEKNTLNILQLPTHTHLLTTTPGEVSIPANVNKGDEDESNPGAGVLANSGTDLYSSTADGVYSGAAIPVTGSKVEIANTGGSQPVNNMQPWLGVNYIIALFGTYPSRN